ncbi:hypothetical protein [Bradyrhizobium sp. McL0616]
MNRNAKMQSMRTTTGVQDLPHGPAMPVSSAGRRDINRSLTI